MGSKGNLCLYELEGVLIDKNFNGILRQLIRRMDSILLKGVQGDNREDFIEEFQSYWERLPKAKILNSFVKISSYSKIIKYSDNKKNVKKKKDEKFIDVLEKENRYMMFASDTGDQFKLYDKINPVKNGVYIYIKANDFILPPDWREGLSYKYINKLLNHPSVSKLEILEYLNRFHRQIFIMFAVRQPNNIITTFGVYINGFAYSSNDSEIIMRAPIDLIPCSVSRCDKDFLLDRGGMYRDIDDIKLLVIGCGSIGGYLVNELVKAGFSNINIVDSDILKAENTYRHLLGMEYVGNYKTVAISEYIKKNFTDVNITSHVDTIQELIKEENISFDDFDIIISAVGCHNVNRWLNQYVHEKQIAKPVIYLWNEVLGIGSHISIFSIKYDSCYECLFSFDSDKEVLYNRASYCEKGQLFTRRVQGCGSSFLPYSSINSLTTVITGVKTIIKYIEGNVTDNYIISIKGDDGYLRDAGYMPSAKFFNQKQTELITEGNKIRNDSCSCCRNLKGS